MTRSELTGATAGLQFGFTGGQVSAVIRLYDRSIIPNGFAGPSARRDEIRTILIADLEMNPEDADSWLNHYKV
jgi:hypothetical protein